MVQGQVATLIRVWRQCCGISLLCDRAARRKRLELKLRLLPLEQVRCCMTHMACCLRAA